MQKMTVEDVVFRDKRVLMRVDFNVPIQKGAVTNDKRIRAALPTIAHILEDGGKLILMSHLGRPKGERNPDMSLKPCAAVLSNLIGREVVFAEDCVGDIAAGAAARLKPGQILLLENLRFHAEETRNEESFAKALAGLGEIYVNDAFGTAHRAHASTEGVTKFIQPAVAGFLIMKELDYLGGLLDNPRRPFAAILGGAKISGKIDVIQELLPKVDKLLVGGGMAYTFLCAQGKSVGRSLLEKDKVDLARRLLTEGGEKIILPVDCKASSNFDLKAGQAGEIQSFSVDRIPNDAAGLDIGAETISLFKSALADAQTVVWNGPMGVFEIPETAVGTFEIAKLLAEISDKGARTVIGGGDSAAAAEKAGVAERISHISTGGGASLEFLEGKTLPGIASLSEKQR
ncbi:MAG: phosphoglycerate kinase [Desulfobacteraceae bacterium]